MPFGWCTCGIEWHNVSDGGFCPAAEMEICRVEPTAKTCICFRLTNKGDLWFTRWQHWSAILPSPNYSGSCFCCSSPVYDEAAAATVSRWRDDVTFSMTTTPDLTRELATPTTDWTLTVRQLALHSISFKNVAERYGIWTSANCSLLASGVNRAFSQKWDQDFPCSIRCFNVLMLLAA